MDIIERYQFRLNVGRREYLWTRTRVRTRQLRNKIEKNLIGRALYGLQKCVSRLLSERYTRTGHQPGLPAPIEAALQQQVSSGDILVTRKEHALTNYFLPGYWPHVALYLGTMPEIEAMGLRGQEQVMQTWERLRVCDHGCDGRVLEALKDGVRLRSIKTPLMSDAVAIVRPQLSPADIHAALHRGVVHAGKPYDFDFDFTRSDRMVCTEVIYRTYEGIGGLHFDLVPRAGRLTISAEDLLERALQKNGFEIHAVYSPSVSAKEIKFGNDAAEAIHRTMNETSG